MLHIHNQFGVVIDDNALNVALVHKQQIDLDKYPPMYFDVREYLGDDVGAGFYVDVPIDERIGQAIVGVEFRYGIGYSQITLKKQNKRTARIYLCLHKRVFLYSYPKYAYLANKPAHEILKAVLKQEAIHVLLFCVNPPVKDTGLGLEVFDKNGQAIFDSDLPTMTFPPNLSIQADNYRSFIVVLGFCPLFMLARSDYPPIHMAVNHRGLVLFYMGGQTNTKIILGEMSSTLYRLGGRDYLGQAHDSPYVRLATDLSINANRRFILGAY